MSSSSSDSSSSDSESSTRAAQRSQKRKRSSPDAHKDSDSASSSAPAQSSDAEASDAEDSDAEDAVADDDVPVLSHAEQRRQKKKQLKAEESAAADDDDGSAPKAKKQKVKNTAELAPSKVPKRQNSVWVGNLAFKTTPEAIRTFFAGCGEITRVHMPMKMASTGPGGRGAVKQNRGFAYVDFATPDAKTVAIALSENPLDGRKLLIKDGGDFTGRPAPADQPEGTDGQGAKTALTGHSKTAQKILSVQKQPPGPTLFMGNLGFETTEQSIRDLFTRNRTRKVEADAEDADEEKQEKPEKSDRFIRKIRMGTFEDTGKCKGWAFADFYTTDLATTALTNPKNHFLDGRKLVVEYASPEAVRRGGAGPRDKGKGAPPRSRPDGDAAQGEEQQDGEGEQRKRRGERVRPKRKSEAGGAEDGEQPAKRARVEREAPPHAEDDGRRDARGSRGGREGREGRDSRPKVRAKPGAALANAKREAVGIVPSEGKKIVF
ncbi:RNA-binding domain-containing protein [Phanerochaete sordida]|uniref:RNA-binding domain-containing protein n=1 Tax=Phanerochaete sordida TaxID=48140 RepID=A0A9P3FXW2_9APHY|nr:RNA-binding domain-containing protein [Phanerochaete sordida]